MEGDENDDKFETQNYRNVKSNENQISYRVNSSNSNHPSYFNKQFHEILHNLNNQDKVELAEYLMSLIQEQKNLDPLPKPHKNNNTDQNQLNNNHNIKISETYLSKSNTKRNLIIEEKNNNNEIKLPKKQKETILPLDTYDNSFCFDKISSPLSEERFINKDLHLNEIDNSSDKSKSFVFNDFTGMSKQEFSIKNRKRSESYKKLNLENNFPLTNNERRNEKEKNKNDKNQLKNQYLNNIRNESEEKSDTPEFNARIILKQEEEQNQINEKKKDKKAKAINEINKEDKKKDIKEIQKKSSEDLGNNNKQKMNLEMKNNYKIKTGNKDSINSKSEEKIYLNLVSESANHINNNLLLGKKRKCESSKNNTDEESLQIKKVF